MTVDEAGMEVTGVLVFLFSQGDFTLYEFLVLKKFLRFGGCKPTFVKPCPPKRQGNVASTWLKLSQPPKFSQRKKIIEENNFALNVERVVKLKARFYFIF